jgi:hypothetical protein
MKYNYSFNCDLSSNNKFTEDELESIRSNIESKLSFSELYIILGDSIKLNENGVLEIYLEDFKFDSDLSIEIEELCKEMDDLIPEGWFKDSTIEFNSIHPPIKYLWYKDDNKWRNSVKNLERDDFFSNPPWKEDEYINDDYETYDNYSDDYDDPNW